MKYTLNTVSDCEQLLSELRTGRTEREAAWRELSRWLCPWRGIFSQERRRGGVDYDDIKLFTGVASHACVKGASGMTSGMTPRNVAWFKPEFSEAALMEVSGARVWLDNLDKILKDTLATGGFYQAIQNFNLDLIWAGCALLYSEKGRSSPLRYECAQVGTYFVALDTEGRLEAVARDYEMSAKSLADIFGEEKLSSDAKADLKTAPWRPRHIISLVCRDNSGSMPVTSRYWEEGANEFLRKAGFHEMPYFFSVWNEGATPYGTGPGDECIADARQLDMLERNKLAGLAKIVDPPLAVPASMKDDIDLSPGAINYIANYNEKIVPILDLSPYAAALNRVQEEIARVSRRLNAGLMAEIFSSVPIDQRAPNMTASEFFERKREALQQLGPVISAYEPNVLVPLLMRQLSALDRGQLLSPLPDELQGIDLFMKIEFLSPVANALRQTSVESIHAFFQDVAGVVQATQNPEVLDKLDTDQMIDELATGLGAPGSIVRSDEDVAKIRQQRADQQAQMMQMQMQMRQQQEGGEQGEVKNDAGGNLL